MSFLDVMQSYFRGEKLEAFFAILPVGLLLIAFGALAIKAERGGYAWSIAIPSILFGLVLVATGIGVGTRTNGQVAELKASYEKAPAAMAKKELPRMQKVNQNFRTTFYAFGALALLGLILHFAIQAGWSRGLGAVLVLVGAIGLLVDGFAERRAEPYTKALVELADNNPDAKQGPP